MSEKPTGQRLADLEAAVATLQREGAVLVDGLNALVRRVLALETTTAPVYVVNGPLAPAPPEPPAALPGMPPMPCCGALDEGVVRAVRWNPSIQQVQCHRCGRIYRPSGEYGPIPIPSVCDDRTCGTCYGDSAKEGR